MFGFSKNKKKEITNPFYLREDFISKAIKIATSSYHGIYIFAHLDKKEVWEIGIKKMEEILEEYDRLHLWFTTDEATVHALSDEVYHAIEIKDREKANASLETEE